MGDCCKGSCYGCCCICSVKLYSFMAVGSVITRSEVEVRSNFISCLLLAPSTTSHLGGDTAEKDKAEAATAECD